MSEQNGRETTTKRRRSRKSNAIDQQNGQKALAPTRPTNDNQEAWKAYWRSKGQPWRHEPEIDAERQKYLDERRRITPDIEQGIYPFKDIRLTRADVEWLLATHENGRGPIDWTDEGQRPREGLDLRGANLAQVDLSRLPLTRTHAGLSWDEWEKATVEQRDMAAAHLEHAHLVTTHLERTLLRNIHLEEANIGWAHLKGADLRQAHLEGAILTRAHLEGAFLIETHLEGADLRRAFFDNETSLYGCMLGNGTDRNILVTDMHWGEADLAQVNWSLLNTLGDERVAREKTHDGVAKEPSTRLFEYEAAVRANRQLAVALREQGLNELADHFAYRAQLLQRTLWRLQRRPLKFILSWFLHLLAGYGYRPLRSVLVYLCVIAAFALGYYEVTHVLHAQPYPLAWCDFIGLLALILTHIVAVP